MQQKQVIVYRSMGPLAFIGIIFVVLKLVGEHFHTPVADWSWFWVLCPFWLCPAIAVGIFAVCLVFALICAVLAAVLGGTSKPRYRR